MSYLNDGHPTLIDFSIKPDSGTPDPDMEAGATIALSFKEKRVTPIGVDGGGPNDTTTMRNATWRTQQPKKLKTLTEMSATVSYDPEVMVKRPSGGPSTDLVSEINVNRKIRCTFANGAKLTFWGWLNNFSPGESAEGSQPEATIQVFASNENFAGVETAPVFTVPA